MKHLLLTLFCASALTLDVSAQIYSNDGAMMMPTRDLYSSWQSYGDIASAAKLAAEADYRRKQYYEYHAAEAYDSYRKGDYYNCIHSSSEALETGYYSADLYYIRGVSFEHLGNYKQAKKCYRKARKKGSISARSALRALKMRNKNK